MKRIFILGMAVILILSLLPVFQATATEYGTVTGGWLRLRAAPSFDAAILKSYYTGTVVELLGTSGDWYSVKTPDNKAGYMHSDYISLGGSPSALTKYVTSSNGYGVRLRSGPSKGYRVIAVYPVGTQVSVLQTGVIWSRIQIGTTVGFMMSEFLTSTEPGTSPSTPEGDDMATVWSSNGYGVRLRSGPGTSYSIIGLYSVGTRVDVQTRDTDWDYIRVGSRLGYMMNEFLIYDDPDQTVATGITVTADYPTGMPGETVDLDVTVTGTDLSSPAYTLAVTGNGSMAEIVSGQLSILSTATVGAVIEVTATTTDDDADGNPITDTCTVTVTAAEPRVTAFSFDETTATVSIAGGDVERRIGYTISGYNLTSPRFSLAVSAEAGGNVTTSIDETSEEIVLNISSAIADGTVFTVTGTTTADDAGGNPMTSVLTVTVTSDVITLTSIELVPSKTTMRQDESSVINATLHYSDGSYISNASTSKYSISITGGSTYAMLTGITLEAIPFTTAGNQTITISGVSTEDSSITDTCTVEILTRTAPGAPTITETVGSDGRVTVHWSAPANDGGEDITGYKLWHSTSSDAGSSKTEITLPTDPTLREYTVIGLTNGLDYYWWLKASNTIGDSDYSAPLIGTPNASTPDAPGGLGVTSVAHLEVTLSWTAPYDGGDAITGYMVRVLEGGVVLSSHPAATTTLAVPVPTNGTTYTFSVRAVNSLGEGAESTTTGNAVGVPDAPLLTQLLYDDSQLTVRWSIDGISNGGHAIDSFSVIYRKSAADPSTEVSVPMGASDREAVITPLDNGDEYTVWVVSNNTVYDSDRSAPRTETPSTVPAAPASLTAATTGSTTVDLVWVAGSDGGSDITEYTVYYNDTTGDVLFGSFSPSTLSTTVTELSPATAYTFSVYAHNANGRSDTPATASATTGS